MLSLCALVAGVVRTSVSAEAEWHDEPAPERSVRAEEGPLAGLVELADDLMTHEGPLWALLNEKPELKQKQKDGEWALVEKPLVGHSKKGWGSVPDGAAEFKLPLKEVLTARLQCKDIHPARADGWHEFQNMALRKNADIDLFTWWDRDSGREKQRVGSFATDQTNVIYEYKYSINSNRPNDEGYVSGISGTVPHYKAWKETMNCKELEVTFYQSQPLFDVVPNSAAKVLNVLLGKRTYKNVEIPLTRGRKNLMLPFTQKCEVVHEFSKEKTMQAVGKKVIEPEHCTAGKPGAVVLSGEWRQTKDWTPEDVDPDTHFIIGRVVWYLDK